MKTNVLIMLMTGLCVLASVGYGATVGSDNAGNYTTWNNGSNQGTGFGAWDIWTSGGGAGQFIEGVAAGFGNINTSGKAFGMWGSPDYVNCQRQFAGGALSEGQTFSIRVAKMWRNGNAGIDVFDASWNNLFNFNIGGDDYTAKGSSLGWAYHGDTIVELSVTRVSGNAGTVVLKRYTNYVSGACLVNSVTYNETFAGAPNAFKLYCGATGGGANNNFYANDLGIVPEPAGLLAVVGAMLMLRRVRG